MGDLGGLVLIRNGAIPGIGESYNFAVGGGFSPRRKDAKFGWRASACPRITRMSRIPHATRPSLRRAYTSLLLYCLLSIFYLLTQVDHERHESHERFFLGQQSAPRHHQCGGFC
jgi:hypothetical protein